MAAFSSKQSSRARALAALALMGGLMPACAVEPSDADEATSLGEARDAVTSGCVTIQRGTLGNVEDAHIATDPGDPTKANKNWGASQGFSAGLVAPGVRQALVQWDLSAVPGPSTVTSATATLHTVLGADGGMISAHRVTAGWQEASVTYNGFGGAFLPAAASVFPATSVASADLTAVAQGWVSGATPNHGVLLDRPLGNFTTFASSEAPTVSDRPALQVCYACVGPVGFWRGDNDMLDSAGANHGASGTQNGATPVGFGAGQVAGAFALGGQSYVQIPNSPSLDITAAITMEAWIFANSLGGRIVDKITAGLGDGYLIDTLTGRLRVIIGNSQLLTPSLLPTGTWVHVAATWDGTTAKVYINGALEGTAPLGPLVSNGHDVRIGADTNGQNQFDGSIDEVAVYDVALTGPQIAAIATAGPGARCLP